MNQPPPAQHGSIFTAARQVLAALPQVLSGLLSLSGVAYAVGWIQARAYFRTFGAEWLVSQLTISDLLRFSWTPLVLVAYISWLGLTDLADTGGRIDSGRFRATLFILRNGWILVLLFASAYALEMAGYQSLATVAAVLTMWGYVLFAGAAFEAIVMYVREGRFFGELAGYLVFGGVVAGLYFVPTLSGQIDGQKASNPALSGLPVVRSARVDRQDLRLILLTQQGIAYVAELAGPKSKIYALPLADLQMIVPKSAAGSADAPAKPPPGPVKTSP